MHKLGRLPSSISLIGIGILIMVVFAASSSLGADYEVSLDVVQGETSPGVLAPGPVRFLVRFSVAPAADQVIAMANAFRVYSDDGATWTNLVADTTMLDWSGIFNYFGFGESIEAGRSADSVWLLGASYYPGVGWDPGFSEIAYFIEFDLSEAATGTTICLDSISSGGWPWAWNLSSGGSAQPDWQGPFCFTVGGCGSTGDEDADGYVDDCDFCPNDPDNDIDADTYCGDVDNCPVLFNPGQEDADLNGVGDRCEPAIDPDPDNDGILDDGDGSGVAGDNPCTGGATANCDDNCPDMANPDQADSDFDGVGDLCDPDADGDGILEDGDLSGAAGDNPCTGGETLNCDDNCPGTFNDDQADADLDGIGDVCDPDADGDGILEDGDFSGVAGDNPCTGGETLNCDDNCPGTFNDDQVDANSDGIGDVCQVEDPDGDGILSDGDGSGVVGDRPCMSYETQGCDDNCPNTANPNQMDEDEDGVGDVCDNCLWMPNSDQADEDEDGLGDMCDLCPGVQTPENGDSDHDGVGDGCDPARLDFAIDPVIGFVPLSSNFSNFSEPTVSGTDLTCLWEFGDGETSTEWSPEHVYQQAGIYDVTLTISDGTYSQTETMQRFIGVHEDVDFTWVAAGPNVYYQVIPAQSDGWAYQYYWSFGDGSSVSTAIPWTDHAYAEPGLYSTNVRVYVANGGSWTWEDISHVILVSGTGSGSNRYVDFRGVPRIGTAPLVVQFTDLSSDAPDSWLWDFGDGQMSTLQHPSHTYSEEGRYTVSLHVTWGLSSGDHKVLDYVYADDPITDLQIGGFNTGARPGFHYQYVLDITNTGTVPAEDCVFEFLPPAQADVVSANVVWHGTGEDNGYTISGGKLVFPFGTMGPTEFAGIVLVIDCYLPPPPTVVVGETISAELWITSTTAESDLTNNYYRIVDEVVGSMDPNDKLAFPSGEGSLSEIESDDRLHYVIQFENKPEATADAIYVTIVDTLDAKLDWGTLSFDAMSHPEPCSYEFDPDKGIIVWYCDSIMLPPNVTAPEGEGYVSFSISPDSGLSPGTELSNTAWIRFDYNEWLQAPEEGPVIRTISQPLCCGRYTSGYTGNTDCDVDGKMNLADITKLIDRIYLSKQVLCCEENGNVDGDSESKMNLADITKLIDHIYLSKQPTAACP